MNWEAVGAVAELIGAIGVVASLVYLAIRLCEAVDRAIPEYAQQVATGALSAPDALELGAHPLPIQVAIDAPF